MSLPLCAPKRVHAWLGPRFALMVILLRNAKIYSVTNSRIFDETESISRNHRISVTSKLWKRKCLIIDSEEDQENELQFAWIHFPYRPATLMQIFNRESRKLSRGPHHMQWGWCNTDEGIRQSLEWRERGLTIQNSHLFIFITGKIYPVYSMLVN